MSRVRGNEGFGLIEAVVSLTILGVMLAALLPALAGNMSLNTTGELRTGAVAAAQEVLDRLRSSEDDWPASGSEEEVSLGEATYVVTLDYAKYCDAVACFDDARNVTAEVSHDGQQLYEVETVFTSLEP
jgi:type II secretory pathway pseudopilin PulG